MSSHPPVRLEHKAAVAALLEPRPALGGRADRHTGTTRVDETGTIEALVAVSGVVDDVGDLIQVGALGLAVKARKPRLVLGHDWNRPVGQVVSAVELLPGDPRLPATAPDGTPWPKSAGALWVRAKFLLGTKDGREAYEVAKAFGPEQNFSIGYKVNKARNRAGVRIIEALDVYEASPVLFGANKWARQLSVKSAASAVVETKSTGSVTRAAQRRLFNNPITCSICGRPAATALSALAPTTKLICQSCVAAVDQVAVDSGYLDPDDLAAAAELADTDGLTPEAAYEAALNDEHEWHLQPDGTLGTDTYSAWHRNC